MLRDGRSPSNYWAALLKEILREIEQEQVPKETPSHNGLYRGTVPVRIIPECTFGEQLDHGKRLIEGKVGHLGMSIRSWVNQSKQLRGRRRGENFFRTNNPRKAVR